MIADFGIAVLTLGITVGCLWVLPAPSVKDRSVILLVGVLGILVQGLAARANRNSFAN